MDGNVTPFPARPLRVVEQSPAGTHDFGAYRPHPPEHRPRRRPDRYELWSWADGYAIYDCGALVVTIHGPNLDLAGRLLRRLNEDEGGPTEPPAAA
ncbi:hypothetical protein [Phenylobacterium sp.]|uniref:hypothetical protein n=1 Tax=Phenylobacterium sp. TaxID=1871053 RepID=UPI0039451109